MRRATALVVVALAAAGCGGEEFCACLPEPSAKSSAPPRTPPPAPPRPEGEVRAALAATYTSGPVRSLWLDPEECVRFGDALREPDVVRGPADGLCLYRDGFASGGYKDMLGEGTDAPPAEAVCQGLDHRGVRESPPVLQANRYYCVTTGGTRTVLHAREDGGRRQILFVVLERFAR
ncbi:hypothetical protein GCM10010182_62040 [Actinomadura cremea]|nr:hypothetical protein GCM10010182_62040 [Actinomadura cremea]